MVYLIKTEIISKEMDKYTDRALLVMLTLVLCGGLGGVAVRVLASNL